MVGEETALGGDGGGLGPPDQGDGQAPQRRHHLGGVATAQPGAIFAEGDIAHPVPCLDAPMAPHQGEQLSSRGPVRATAGDKVGDLHMGALPVPYRADELRDLGQPGKAGQERRMAGGGHAQRACFGAPAPPVRGRDLRIGRLGVGKAK